MPSMVNLTHSVNIVAKDIISVVASFPRIRNQNFDPDASKTSFANGQNGQNGINGNNGPNGVHGGKAASSVSVVDPVNSNGGSVAGVPGTGGTGPGTGQTGVINNARLAAVEIINNDNNGLINNGNNNSNSNLNNNNTFDSENNMLDANILSQSKTYTKSYYEIISEDTDILRIVVLVMNGMSSTATELQKYLSYWEKYKGLWEMDKDVYMRKQAKASKSSSQFESEITRFRSQQSDIYSETSTHIINFVRVDCNVLKDALVGHCLQCQTKLTGLLNQNGAQELEEIFTLFRRSKTALSSLPASLDELSAKIAHCRELKDQVTATQQRFEPLREIYATLNKFEVAVKENELNKLISLDTAFDEYTTMLYDTEKMLDKSKVSMKKELETQLDSYNTQMTDMRAISQTELPYSQDRTATEAMAIITLYRNKILKAKEREVSLATGLNIFGILSSEHKELTAVTKDIDLLHQIWSITIEWKEYWDLWKTGQFADLNVEEMENVAGGYSKRVGKLGKSCSFILILSSQHTKLI